MFAFDIDGVCADFNHAFRKTGVELLERDLPKVPKVWDLRESYGLTRDEEKRIWSSQELIDNLREAPMLVMGRHFANEAPQGSVFLTARGSNLSYSNALPIRAITIEWLKKHGFPNFEVVFSNDKVEYITKHRFTRAYEDCPEHVEELAAAGVTVFMPLYEYNKHLRNTPNVFPVGGWL